MIRPFLKEAIAKKKKIFRKSPRPITLAPSRRNKRSKKKKKKLTKKQQHQNIFLFKKIFRVISFFLQRVYVIRMVLQNTTCKQHTTKKEQPKKMNKQIYKKK